MSRELGLVKLFFLLCQKTKIGGGESLKREERLRPPKYVMIPLDMLVRFIICVILDGLEFIVPILLSPLIGDILDIVGLGIGLTMFGWVGGLTILEFLPGADYFPIFIFTWAVWYYNIKRQARKQREKMQ